MTGTSGTSTVLGAVRADGERARALLDAGGGRLAWQTTWPGHRYWFGDGSAVAYRPIRSVALATGGPIGWGDPRRAVAGFQDHCRATGTTPALLGVDAAVRRVCTDLGWSAMQVAEEPVVALPGLTFSGRRWQDVRTARNRCRRDGVRAVWVRPADADPRLRRQIGEISDAWLTRKGLPELGLTLGGIAELDDPAVRCLVALDGHDDCHGVTSWMPVHRGGDVVGWALDVMRRRPGAAPGVVEFLIATALERMRAEGAQFASLSGCPLVRMPERGPATRPEALLQHAGDLLEPAYGFRSLHAFKLKFQPAMEPLYLCWPRPAALPRVVRAVIDGFLPGISLRDRARLAWSLRR